MPRVLILGGTGEARSLAARLADRGSVDVISSLAGRVRDPVLPAGEVRIGGFGGADGLAAWLGANPVDAIIDATHPFAARITANAVLAAAKCAVPLAILQRPAWSPENGDRWHEVADLAEAAAIVPQIGRRVFLTIGRQGVDAFADLDQLWFLIRAIDPPEVAVPRGSELLLARGPFTVETEIELMRAHSIEVLVTKNSGGAQTAAKLEAARTLGIPVVMVRRPVLPGGVRVVTDIAGGIEWIERATADDPRQTEPKPGM